MTVLCAAAFAQQPRIDSISPSQGPIAGGTIVTIAGAGFTGAAVKLDRGAIAPLSQSDSEIRLQMPKHDNGIAVIGVGNAAAEFLYIPPPLRDLPPGYITTVAGIGSFTRDYGPATQAILSAPWSLEVDRDGNLAEVRLRPKAGADDERAEDELERLDPDEVVARIIAQITEPRKQMIHNYGRYANAARAKREREAAAAGDCAATAPRSVTSEPDSAERKAARKRWANLIRHIYEVDPLLCPRCGGMMKIIAFITEPRAVRAILDSVRRSGTPSAAGSRTLHLPLARPRMACSEG